MSCVDGRALWITVTTAPCLSASLMSGSQATQRGSCSRLAGQVSCLNLLGLNASTRGSLRHPRFPLPCPHSCALRVLGALPPERSGGTCPHPYPVPLAMEPMRPRVLVLLSGCLSFSWKSPVVLLAHGSIPICLRLHSYPRPKA